jgi:PAS domain S-box-containing protein/diguanylate cyclase (GGDEF)-like protein
MNSSGSSLPANPGVAASGARLSNLSITAKLTLMVLSLAAVSGALVMVIVFALDVGTGVRAYISGEGLYSKGQKDAVYYLTRYARFRSEDDYVKYRRAIAFPLGDHQARIELQRRELDAAAAASGFIQGGNDPEDVPYMVSMFRNFHGVSYFARAIELWTAADEQIAALVSSGDELHTEILKPDIDEQRVATILNRIESINAAVTPIEDEFSATLGQAARLIRQVILRSIYVLALALLGASLWLSWMIAREIRISILDLRNAAIRVAQGDLDHFVQVRSGDELGKLATAFNQMIEHRKSAEDALRGATEFREKVMQSASNAIYVFDPQGRFTLANQRACDITGYDVDKLLGTQYQVLFDPPHVNAVIQQFNFVAGGNGTVTNFETPLVRLDGKIIIITFSLAPLLKDGRIVGVVGTAEDVTERRRAELELSARGKELLRLNRIHGMLSSVSSMIVRVRDRQELLQQTCRIAVEYGGFPTAFIGEIPPHEQDGRPVAWAGIDNGYAATIRLTTRDDSIYRNRPGNRALREKVRIVCNDVATDPDIVELRADALSKGFRSIAAFPLLVAGAVDSVLLLFAGEPGFFNHEELKLLEELVGDVSLALGSIAKEHRLEFLTNFDPLTGLANRTLFMDRIDQTMISTDRKSGFALAVMEIERFDALSHSLGQASTDLLISEMAQRLRNSLGEQATLARVTHKAFAVPVPRNSDSTAIDWMEQRLLGIFDTPFCIDGDDLRFSGCIGVSLFPADGAKPDELLHNAESALERARESSEKVFFYAPAMNLRLAQRLTLETKLRQAIKRQEFVVHYQPKIDIATDTINGAEALLRWNDPDGRLVPPAEFIPFLEETGMILEVSGWLLMKVADDLSGTLAGNGEPPRIAVNISPLHLQHRDFLADIQKAIRRGGKFGDHLDLEITESMIMQDVETNIEKLRVVRSIGLDIAIDDFGTGYSSLAYLSRLPATAVKIDQNFVARMFDDGHATKLVATIISLAHSLRLKVIAEGVETQSQLDLLRRMNCDEYQGFIYSPAVPVERLKEILHMHVPAAPRSPR